MAEKGWYANLCNCGLIEEKKATTPNNNYFFMTAQVDLILEFHVDLQILEIDFVYKITVVSCLIDGTQIKWD